MKKRVVYSSLGVALVAALLFAVMPATAELRTVTVRLADGTLLNVQVDVPPGTDLDDIEIPLPPVGTPGGDGGNSGGGSGGSGPSGGSSGDDGGPRSRGGRDQAGSTDRRRPRPGDVAETPTPVDPQGPVETPRRRARRKPTPLRNADGSPTRRNPTFFEALPGPGNVKGVPNFVIRKFRVPPFLLPIYQAAGTQYGVRWEHLAAINEIETDYGRNLNVSSAGAVGWMQFMPATWRAYGVDANRDGVEDPYNPVDAIFAAARYLKAAGYADDVDRALFAYNHADWYVDSVNLRAKLIAGVPSDVIGSLTGLTEGRFPVYAKARYADDLQEREATRRVRRGQNAANLVEGDESRRGIEIYTRRGAPIVAVNDGVVKKIGFSERLGRYIVLQDVYGNRYTYAGLSRVARSYPVPREELGELRSEARATPANDPKPTRAASAGRQADATDSVAPRPAARASQPVKTRLFANPARPNARRAGGAEQLLNRDADLTTFRAYFSRPFGLDPRDVRLRPLRRGSRVIGGTILGRTGQPDATKAPHLYFEIRPAGRGAPRIDPKPILDGWKLLEATAIYRASGRNALHGDDRDGFSIGQVMLLPKPLLERRVLSDERIDIYPCGRQDIRSGQIDRRVLVTLEVLAESGLEPKVTSLKCGHSFYTKSGNVSHHSSGNAVDIAAINGTPVLGHQERGGVTHQAVTRLMQMQGTLLADQIISLIDLGAPTVVMADHADHIHVGFRPLFGSNERLGRQTMAVLKPGQWHDLIAQLRRIDNPVVRTKPSRDATRVGKRRASHAHAGE
jgi:murein DD-endopeptidase MepM/ murein hydrolase activator NlpD